MRYVAILLGLLLAVLLWHGIMFIYPMQLIRDEGPYHGKVIDAETGAPIPGVVVLAMWYHHFPSPAGGMQRFYDAREVVTDANGDFIMPGMGLRILSTLGPIRFLLFKTG